MNDTNYCDNCGNTVKEDNYYFFAECPWDTHSTNEGESARLCICCVDKFKTPKPTNNTMSKYNKLISELNIPEGTKYPSVDFCVDSNIFSVIGAVQKAWSKVNPNVASKIGNVVNSHCQSYDEALGFLMAISEVTYGEDDDLGGLEVDFPDDEEDEG
jgi:hypothetical protein